VRKNVVKERELKGTKVAGGGNGEETKLHNL
jgi:hypothetical protein